MTFKDLNLIAPILEALETEGYTHPTPIQQEAIPIILQQKDLLGCAQTGTGKTAAFALPILQLLTQQQIENRSFGKHIKALILTPTRELAIQIDESFKNYGKNLRLKSLVIFGGVPQGAQVHALKNGTDILIATPGRLLDLIQQKYISLKDISLLILDEADRMLDMGFIHDVKKVVAMVPTQRQTLFFSATMPAEIQKLANTILNKPEKVEVTPVSSTAEKIEQSLYYVDKKDKKKLLAHLLKNKEVRSAIVFTRTKHGADKVVKDLYKDGVRAEAIHGNKSQNARQRALNNFKTGEIHVLIATDIAARGIDVDAISHVINFDLPDVPETYVHRIGRTARAGASGISISFCDVEELDELKAIQKVIGFQIPVVDSHPYPSSESERVVINLPKNKQVVKRPGAVSQGGFHKNRNNKFKQKAQGQGQGKAKPKQNLDNF
ncbi:MAG: DEAD/DEAH box helicase [Sphingobacteriales bacterium]|nr:MAG: DEAD/DEAH box helicase [Sphingobacteriales bacterium]